MTDTRTNTNDMNFEDRDVLLTAYALGELDANQAAEVETMLEGDAAARQAVEEIRATASVLEHEMHAEPAGALSETQRAAITSGPERRAVVASRSQQWWWAGAGLAAAASVALLATLPLWVPMRADQGPPTGEEYAIATDEEVAGSRRGRAVPDAARQQSGNETLRAESDRARAHRRLADQAKSAEGLAAPADPAPPPPPVPPVAAMTPPAEAEVGAAIGGRGLAGGVDADAGADGAPGADGDLNREGYDAITDNPFLSPLNEPLSTLSIDVDTASYSNIRRYIRQWKKLPPKDAVRIEELVNYFTYAGEGPAADAQHPFATHVDVGPAPWAPQHRLVRIGVKAQEIDLDNRPPTNLVFLLDVSGSMNQPNKLPLLKQSFRMLVDELTADDRVAIVVYAGAAGVVLPSTYAHEKQTILDAIDNLRAGGSTAGGAGIELAYNIAQENFIDGGINRVILATDGDFNVGVSSDGELVRLIEQNRESGVFLSVLGFGSGNWQDAKMESLSNAGNGNFAYIDSLDEAKKVLVEELGGTLVTVAKDVKIQVDFNPAQVEAYRLIGYENRLLAAQDFADDTKDAGEVGAGHSLVVLYEIVPKGVEIDLPEVEPSKYAAAEDGTDSAHDDAEDAAEASNEMLEVRVRYKQPDGDTSTLLKHPVVDDGADLDATSDDFRFAAAVAAFGMVLRDSPHKGDATPAMALDLAQSAVAGNAPSSYRADFVQLVQEAQALAAGE